MKLSKTLDGYVVRVPDDVVASLGLKDGDIVELTSRPLVRQRGDEQARAEALPTIQRLAVPFPADYKFDREEANAR